MAHYDISDFDGSDVIDVRDVIARVEELREEKQNVADTVEEAQEAYKFHDSDDTKSTPEWEDLKVAEKDLAEWYDSDECKELVTLESLLDDLKGYGGDEQWEGDWYPVTLIKDSYFEQSMDEMVDDCYDIPKDLPSFMTITLDYDALKQDYSEVEFEGNTYYYR